MRVRPPAPSGACPRPRALPRWRLLHAPVDAPDKSREDPARDRSPRRARNQAPAKRADRLVPANRRHHLLRQQGLHPRPGSAFTAASTLVTTPIRQRNALPRPPAPRANPSAAGFINAQWNGALTASSTTLRAPRSRASCADPLHGRATRRTPPPARRRSGWPAPPPRRRAASAQIPLHGGGLQSENGGHAAPSPCGYGLLHETAPLPHHPAPRPPARARPRTPGRCTLRGCGPPPKRRLGIPTWAFQYPQGGHGRRQDRGLCVSPFG